MTTITTTGNLAADPELRRTKSGRTVIGFTLIENRRRRTADGQGWTDAEPNRFHVTAWGQLAENIAASIHKGSHVTVAGDISTRRWDDTETGQPRTAQSIDAEDVSVSLRFHTVEATKNERASEGHDAASTGEQQTGPAASIPGPEQTGPVISWPVTEIPEGNTPY